MTASLRTMNLLYLIADFRVWWWLDDRITAEERVPKRGNIPTEEIFVRE